MLEPITALKVVRELAGIAKYVYDYIDEVKSAPERTHELSGELKHVRVLLSSMPEIFESKRPVSAEMESAITDVIEMLENLKVRVDESKSKGLERLKWPFKKDENTRLLTRIERYKGIFEIALGLKIAWESLCRCADFLVRIPSFLLMKVYVRNAVRFLSGCLAMISGSSIMRFKMPGRSTLEDDFLLPRNILVRSMERWLHVFSAMA